MFNWLKKAVPTEVRQIFKQPGRLGVNGGLLVASQKLNKLLRAHRARARAEAALRRKLAMMTPIYPPKKGNRRPEWSSQDDLFWTTLPASNSTEGDITSQLVQPRRSLWTLFKVVS